MSPDAKNPADSSKFQDYDPGHTLLSACCSIFSYNSIDSHFNSEKSGVESVSSPFAHLRATAVKIIRKIKT